MTSNLYDYKNRDLHTHTHQHGYRMPHVMWRKLIANNQDENILSILNFFLKCIFFIVIFSSIFSLSPEHVIEIDANKRLFKAIYNKTYTGRIAQLAD